MSTAYSPEQDRKTLDYTHKLMDAAGRTKRPILYGPGSWTATYVRLCGLARRKEATKESTEAMHLIRPMRLLTEEMIITDWEAKPKKEADRLLFGREVFGHSTKQGVSFRLGLSSCTPTPACITRCYAHDGNDCLPQPVARGVYNSLIAKQFEEGDSGERCRIEQALLPHVERAVSASLREMDEARKEGFLRAPRVRFSHVGDIAAYPAFANRIGGMVLHRLDKEVDARGRGLQPGVVVTYTRRKSATRLAPYWTVLFSLDHSTPKPMVDLAHNNRVPIARVAWRIAWCGFNSTASDTADVTFVEHHTHQRLPITSGGGFVCPATKEGNKRHGCDSNRCDLCFRPM